jgi:hypothetical protein
MSYEGSDSDGSILSLTPYNNTKISVCMSIDPYASQSVDMINDKDSLITISTLGKYTRSFNIPATRKKYVQDITHNKCTCSLF